MPPSSPPQAFAVVRVVAIRADRIAAATARHRRLPRIGDLATVVDRHAWPTPACEVECSDPEAGETIRLEALHLDETEPLLP